MKLVSSHCPIYTSSYQNNSKMTPCSPFQASRQAEPKKLAQPLAKNGHGQYKPHLPKEQAKA